MGVVASAGALLVLLVSPCLSSPVLGQEPSRPGAGPVAAEDPLASARAVLTDARSDAPARRAAARTLLQSGDRDSVNSLLSLLRPGADAAATGSIVQVLATHSGDLDDAFAAPLFSLLGRLDAALAPDLAAALGRFSDRRLARRVLDVAVSESSDLPRRRDAVLALGYYRTQENAQALLRLIEPYQPQAVRSAAFESLATLSGLPDPGTDATAWQNWWASARRMNEPQWLAHLLDNHARRAIRVAASAQQARDRLIEAQRQVYRVTDRAEQPALLVTMLSDTQPGVRQLALDLCFQRLVDSQEVGPELRAAFIARLSDPVAGVRQRAAGLIEAVKDETGADAVAARLAQGHEPDPAVLGAYLTVMWRLPREAGVRAALDFLNDPSLHGQAARALAAGVDAGVIERGVVYRASAPLRQKLRDGSLPDPRFVELLGMIGDPVDWQRIQGWLDSQSDAVREAAARAWERSDRPLELLAERAGDPVIQPIAIAAVARRGTRPETLLAIIEHRPEQEQAEQAWQQALVSMATRVPLRTVLYAEQSLRRRGAPIALRLQLIDAAGEPLMALHTASSSPLRADLIELLIRRGQLHAEAGDPNAALADLQLVTASNVTLNPAMRRTLDTALVQVHLPLGGLDPATEAARRLLADNTDPRIRASLCDLFILNAQRSIDANQLDRARQLLTRLRELLGPEIDAQRTRLLDELTTRLAAASSPAPGSAPTPGTPGTPGTTPGGVTPGSDPGVAPAPAEAGAPPSGAATPGAPIPGSPQRTAPGSAPNPPAPETPTTPATSAQSQ